MKNNKIWLVILIAFLIFSLIGAAFAYLAVTENKIGPFTTNVETRNVDILTYENVTAANMVIDCFNFNKATGKDVSANATLGINLFTSKDEVKYCYKMDAILPKETEPHFVSTDGTPELVFDLYENDKLIIENKDLTSIFDRLPLTNEKGSEVFELVATKGKYKINNYVAKLTFKYKNLDQEINNKINYLLKLESYLVDCNDPNIRLDSYLN